MSKALTGARAELGEFAPRIETMKIPTDKIREVIGTGGKVIREIVEKTGAKINIEDDGTVKIASADDAKIKAAINWIKSIAVGARGRPDLRRHGGQDDGVRRLRELLRREGRPRPHLAARARAASPRRPTSSRKATRSRSSSWASTTAARSPVDEGRRPADRRGSRAKEKGERRPPENKARSRSIADFSDHASILARIGRGRPRT